MKILFAASEAAPYIKTGGLGDVALALPKALAAAGHEVKIVLPLYGAIKRNEPLFSRLSFVSDYQTKLAWRSQYSGLFREGEGHNPEYLFIDNEYYFNRNASTRIYGDGDDGERFAFFSRALLEGLSVLGFTPDIIHCNDWQTALVPTFLRQFYPQYHGIKTVFTIHNIEYQGKMPQAFAWDVAGVDRYFTERLTYDGCINLMKGAIVEADAITTVSETYASEILGAFFGQGLHGILGENRAKLCGIVNGIDTDVFNPETDPALAVNYKGTVAGLAARQENKRFLQERLGLALDENVPIVSMVGRLVSHKGLDLVEHILHEIMALGVQFVVLGTGDRRYEERLSEIASRYPGRMSVNILFDGALASQIYAGSDLFLMPSLTEPCGLSQMVAMRYGAVPIVRETGGLHDTVPAYHPIEKTGRGFTFVDYNAHEMLGAIRRAVTMYREQKMDFDALQRRNMKEAFGWELSVKRYEALYRRLCGREE